MHKRGLGVIGLFAITCLFFLPFASAVWWNPFTWLQKDVQLSPERDVLYDVNNLSANLQPVDITACFQGKG
ncbi:hypothetical protein HYZ97_03085, partial [Candidatus Pacearchaeota archaeon]|nr:hypothetical protein [Candidatus Pacearchaeota archaeon]